MSYYGIMPQLNNKNNKRCFRRGTRIATRQLSASKYVSIPLTTTFSSISSSWSLYEPTNLIRIGTDFGFRLGRLVRVTSLMTKGMLVGGQVNLGTDDSRNIVRLVVALVGDGFDATKLSGVSLDTPITNMNVTGLMRVYTDRLFNLSTFSRDTVGYVPAQRSVSVNSYINERVLYNDSLGGFSPVPKVVIFMRSDSAAVPSPGFVSGYIQIRFQSLAS
jgi:hypothetical protein